MFESSRREFLRQTAVTMAAAALASTSGLPAGAAPLDTGFMDNSGDEIMFGGQKLSWWIKKFGLPLHLNYAPDISANMLAFVEVFKRLYPAGEVRFAGKSSTHPAIFRLAQEAGIGVDVASPYEARCALNARVDPRHLDVNGNSKDDGLINLAIAHDMVLVVDSADELDRISALAKAHGKKPRVVLRVTGFNLGTVTAAAIFTAGVWSKFGIPLDDIPGLLPKLGAMPVDVLGFHTHIGSQITDLNAYRLVLGKLLELGGALNDAGGKLRVVNVGGGFPVSYIPQDQWDALLKRISDGYVAASNGDTSKIWLWDNQLGAFTRDDAGMPTGEWAGELFTTPYPKERMLEALLGSDVTVNGKTLKATDALAAAGSPALVVEPGRAIVSDAGITLASVSFLKRILGQHNLISLDLGTVNYGEALVALPAREWALITDHKRKDPQPFDTFIAGNLCFSGDMLSRLKVPLQRAPVRGDVLLIGSTGAYNPTFFASNANSFPRPNRILIDGKGGWTYLKRVDTYQEIFSL